MDSSQTVVASVATPDLVLLGETFVVAVADGGIFEIIKIVAN